MLMQSLTNVINASSFSPLPDLSVSLTNAALDKQLYGFIKTQREEIKHIISGEDSRLLVIIGPWMYYLSATDNLAITKSLITMLWGSGFIAKRRRCYRRFLC